MTGKDRSQFTLSNIRNSSVYIDGVMNVANTADQTALMTTLNALNAGSATIAGYPVTATLTAVTVDNTTAPPGNNTNVYVPVSDEA